MKKNLLKIFILILIAAFSVCVWCACDKKTEEPESIVITLEANSKSGIKAGNYTIPLEVTVNGIEIEDWSDEDNVFQITITATDNFANKVSVKNGKIKIEAGKTYSVTIVLTYTDNVTGQEKEIKKYITLTAKADDTETVTVDFMVNNKISQSTTLPKGQTVSKPDDPTAQGYDFLYWYSSDENTPFDFNSPIEKSIMVFAKFSLVEYTATLDADGGSLQTAFVKTSVLNNYLLDLPVPEKEGYTFSYWFIPTIDGTNEKPFDATRPVSSNLSLKAKYELLRYPVTVVLDDTEEVVYTDLTTNYKFVYKTPTKPDMVFKDWYVYDKENNVMTERFDLDTQVKQPLVLIPYFVEKVFYITFSFNNGQEDLIVTVSKSADGYVLAQENVPVPDNKQGYTFEGWYKNESKFDFTRVLTDDVSLSAKWKVITVTVNLDLKGADNAELFSAQTTTNIEKDYLLDAITYKPQKEGYEFKYWYLNQNADTPFDFKADTVKTDGNVLCALFDTVKYAVTLKTDVDTVYMNLYTDILSDYKLDLSALQDYSAPLKHGYTFQYWYTLDNASEGFDFDSPILSSVELYSYFTLNVYPVNFYDVWKDEVLTDIHEGYYGTVYGIYRLEDGEKIYRLPQPETIEHYDNKGWYFENEQYLSDSEVTQEIILSVRRETHKYNVNYYVILSDTYEYVLLSEGNGDISGIYPRVNELPAKPDRTGYLNLKWIVGGLNDQGKPIGDELTADYCFTCDSNVYLDYRAKPCELRFFDKETYIGNCSVNYDSKLTKAGLLAKTITLSNSSQAVLSDYIAGLSNEGYFKDGWTINNVPVVFDYTVKEFTVTFYVNWRPIQYKVNAKVYLDTDGDGVWEKIADSAVYTDIEKKYRISEADIKAYIGADPDLEQEFSGNKKALDAVYVTDVFEDENKYDFDHIIAYNSAVQASDGLYELSSDTLTLHLKFSPTKFQIRFFDDEKNLILGYATRIQYGKKLDANAIPSTDLYEKQGYITNGWMYIDNEGASVHVVFDDFAIYSEYDFYVNFEIIEHTIEFYDGLDVKITLKTDITKENKIADPQEVQKDGYEFVGWYYYDDTQVDFTQTLVDLNVTQAQTVKIYSKWQLITYTVTFKTDGEEYALRTVSILTDNKMETVPDDPEKIGYTFEGWFNGDQAFSLSSEIRSDLILNAKFETIKHTVSFIYNGQEYASPTTGTVLGFELPIEPQEENYTFNGWFDQQGNRYDADTPVLYDVVLYARFDEITYQVKFDPNLDAQQPLIKIVGIADNYIVKKPVYSEIKINGMVLENWYTEKTLQNVFDFNQTITSDVTLYGKWRIISGSEDNYVLNSDNVYKTRRYYGGNVINEEKYFIDELSEQGKAASDIYIINSFNHKTVGKISAGAFYDNSNNANTTLKTVTISGDIIIEAMAFANCTSLTDIFIEYVGGVLAFKDTAFVNCISLTNIYVPDSLYDDYICDSQWSYYADYITPFNAVANQTVVKDGVTYLLHNGQALIKGVLKETLEVEVPETINGLPVTRIVGSAFSGSNVNYLVLPENLITIEENAFYGSKNLSEVFLGSKVSYIGNNAFSDCNEGFTLYLKGTPPTIGDTLFKETENYQLIIERAATDAYRANDAWSKYITEDEQPNLSTLSSGAVVVVFETNNSNKITPVILDGQSALKYLPTPYYRGYNFDGWFKDNGTFRNQYLISDAILNSDLILYAKWSLNTEDVNAFFTYEFFDGKAVITGLTDAGKQKTSLTVPATIDGYDVAWIKNGAFIGGAALTSLSVDPALTDYFTDSGILYRRESNSEISLFAFPAAKDATDFIIGTNELPVTYVCEYAFANTKYLGRVTVSESVKEMGSYSFMNSSLTAVTFAQNSIIRRIRYGTFYNCTKLDTVVLPELTECVESWAFASCARINNITFGYSSEPLPVIERLSFYRCSLLTTIVVPKGKTNLYASVEESFNEELKTNFNYEISEGENINNGGYEIGKTDPPTIIILESE